MTTLRPRVRAEPLTPEQLVERQRVIAARRQRKLAASRQHYLAQKAQQTAVREDVAS